MLRISFSGQQAAAARIKSREQARKEEREIEEKMNSF
jgi:hypothetical protein